MLITYFKDSGLVYGCFEEESDFAHLENLAELSFINATPEQYNAVLTNFGCKVVGGCIVLPLGPTKAERLAEAKMLKAEEFNIGITKDITAGFVSSALGAPYKYPSKITDQANMTASITASLLEESPDWTTPFWCENEAGIWAFVIHTKAQIQQVGKDCKNFVLGLQGKKYQLDCELEAIDSINDCKYLSWYELTETPVEEEITDPVPVIIPGYDAEYHPPSNEIVLPDPSLDAVPEESEFAPDMDLVIEELPTFDPGNDEPVLEDKDEDYLPPPENDSLNEVDGEPVVIPPETDEEVEELPPIVEEDEEHLPPPPNKAPIEVPPVTEVVPGGEDEPTPSEVEDSGLVEEVI
jgi:hypothetical protein